MPLGPGGCHRDVNGDVGSLLGDIIVADACDGRRAGCPHKPPIVAVVRSHNNPACLQSLHCHSSSHNAHLHSLHSRIRLLKPACASAASVLSMTMPTVSKCRLKKGRHEGSALLLTFAACSQLLCSGYPQHCTWVVRTKTVAEGKASPEEGVPQAANVRGGLVN